MQWITNRFSQIYSICHVPDNYSSWAAIFKVDGVATYIEYIYRLYILVLFFNDYLLLLEIIDTQLLFNNYYLIIII